MAKYIKIDQEGEICIATEGPGNALEVNGDVLVRGNLTTAPNGTVGGDLTVNGALTVGGSAMGLFDSVSLTGSRSDIEFTKALNTRILWQSATNVSDRAYILYLNDSALDTASDENSRLSIGILNDYKQESPYRDSVDIQGASRLVLNAGLYDPEIIDEFFDADTQLEAAEDSTIEFRINNELKASVTKDGFNFATAVSGAFPLSASLDLTSEDSIIHFSQAAASKILWTSSIDGSDKGYILYLNHSSFVGGASQSSRLSMGIHNNFEGASSIRDGVDIQGGAKLVLNAGVYDQEIIDHFYGSGTGLQPDPNSDIEFRINDVVEARLDRDGMHGFDFLTLSDASLKTDIRPLDDPLSKLLSLKGVLYKWKNRPPDSPDQIGLIAQEVEPYFPEIVVTDVNGLKSVRYSRLVVPLIEVLRTLCLEIEGLKQRIDN